MYEEYVSFRVLLRFFLSPEGAAVFLPASFFSEGVLPAGALPPVEGFFSAALGGIFSGENEKLVEIQRWVTKTESELTEVEKRDNLGTEWDGWGRMEEVAGGEETYTRWQVLVIAWRVPFKPKQSTALSCLWLLLFGNITLVVWISTSPTTVPQL